jgi:O-antigen/teichoic acid export membrane protein
MWYKLSGKTYYGALITLIGAIVTVIINIIYIPRYGYVASAYAHLVCYIVMTIICWILGQKYYSIKYDYKSILFTSVSAILVYFVSNLFTLSIQSLLFKTAVNNFLLLLFIFIVTLQDSKIKNYLYAGSRNK